LVSQERKSFDSADDVERFCTNPQICCEIETAYDRYRKVPMVRVLLATGSSALNYEIKRMERVSAAVLATLVIRSELSGK
jgi:hypothetical protein